MSWGMHKPGQGYWVRVMTATAIGLITLASAFWMMQQMSVLADKLPKNTYMAELGPVSSGEPKAGDRVTLVGPAPTPGAEPAVLGTARIEAFDAAARFVTLKDVQKADSKAQVETATGFRQTEVGGFTAGVKNSVRGQAMISATYLRGGAAVLMLLVGAALAYYFCGLRPGSVDFLISTDMEMKKVNWSTRKDIKTSTLVVVGACFLLTGVLFGIDLVFQQLFKAINILQ